MIVIILLVILGCVFGFKTLWRKVTEIDEALHRGFHAAFVRFSLDSE